MNVPIFSRSDKYIGGVGVMACCLQLSSLLQNSELGVEDIVGFIES